MSPTTSIRRGAAAVAAASAVALAAACGSGSATSGTGGTAQGKTKVAAVIKGLDNPFFQSMQQGIEAQAKAGGVDTTVQAANAITDTTGQADKLTGLAGQDYSCYIVNPISGTNLVQGIAQSTRPPPRRPTPRRPPTSAPTTSRPARWPASR
jgi:ribose transport system substrate-binding protein